MLNSKRGLTKQAFSLFVTLVTVVCDISKLFYSLINLLQVSNFDLICKEEENPFWRKLDLLSKRVL
jgi:hypothetical protein